LDPIIDLITEQEAIENARLLNELRQRTSDPLRSTANATCSAIRRGCDEGHNFSIQNLIAQLYPINSLARVEAMTRREFVKLLPGIVVAWPLIARAQQGTPRLIGVLGADATVWSSWTAAFVTRLRELGWIAGDTIGVEYRWSGGSSKRVSDFTAEFLRRHVDVIVTYGAAAAAVQQATTTTPIVLAVASDPAGGLIASLARPDGNVTGISIQQSKLIGKRLALLREVVPHLRRLVIMANAGYAMPVLEAQEAKATAQALGLEAARLEIWIGGHRTCL
jgi:putative tryptophan/tyrosine transport system substrate-binding protein